MLNSQLIKFWHAPLEQVKKAQNEGRALAIIGIYGVGKTLFTKILLQKIRKQSVIFINLKDIPVPSTEDLCNAIFNEMKKSKLIKEKIFLKSARFRCFYVLQDLLERKTHLKICLLIHGAQNILDVDDFFFESLENLRYKFQPRFSIVLIGRPQLYNFTKSSLQCLIKDNYCFLKPFDFETTAAVIHEEEKSLGKTLSRFSPEVYHYSQGHLGTVKFICKKIKEYQITELSDKNFEFMLENEPLLNTFVSYVAASLSQGQKKLIYNSFEEGSLPDSEKNSANCSMLIELGIFSLKSENLRFIALPFKNRIQAQLKKQIFQTEAISYKNNSICINNKTVVGIFSPQEIRVLQKLLYKKGTLVDYTAVARAAWGRQYKKKFSIVAIHKLISTIRKKLLNYGFEKEAIKTISKSGYSFSVPDSVPTDLP